MKLCIRCKIEKELSAFHKDRRRKDGYFPYCKKCRRERNGAKKMTHKKIGELDGYMIVDDVYPRILLPTGSVRVHRYVMEKKIGRKIYKNEDVHHIDGNKKNWNENNLVILKRSVHRSLEAHNIHGYAPTVRCNTCGKSRTYSNNVIDKGRIVPERYQCANCYYKSGGPSGRKKLLKGINER